MTPSRDCEGYSLVWKHTYGSVIPTESHPRPALPQVSGLFLLLIHNEWRNHSTVCEGRINPFFPFQVDRWEKLTA